jgi:predicted NBD/HSP70 family sugar kinase
MSSTSGNGAKPPTKPRQRNQQDVINALLRRHRLTQQDLVQETGLSRATVARIVSKLIEGELVEPGKGAESAGGVPVDVLSIRPRAGAAMGIDFGKGHVRVAVRDVAGGKEWIRGTEEGEIDVPNESEKSLTRAAELAKEVLEKAGFSPNDLVGAFIGIPAPVDSQGRIAQHTGMPDWRGQQPADELKSRLLWDAPMDTANDASLGAIAELEWGAARGYSNVIYLKWSTGIGGGLIVEGQLVRGADNLAGEIGDVPVPGLAALTSDPSAEGLHSVASGAVIAGSGRLDHMVAEARAEIATGPHRQALKTAAEYVGRALGPIVSALNPEILVVGGAFSRQEGDYNLIADALRRGLRSTTYPASLESLKIDIGTQTGKAAALGGVALVLREHLRQFLFARL